MKLPHLIALVCVSLLVSGCQRRSENSLSIMPDTDGEIRLVVCSATSASKSSLRNSQLVTNIVNGLSDDVHVLILVNDRADFMTAAGRQVTLVEMPKDKKISIWPQDPFVVLQNQNQTQLLVSNRFGRDDDRLMAATLAEKLQLQCVTSELEFEGGNIVVDDESVFIGFDAIDSNATRLKTNRQDIQSRFAAELGRPVRVVGDRSQAIAHIDMIVTPLGNRSVVVADSRLGAEIVGKQLADSPNGVQRFERRCEKEFFGSAVIDQLQVADGSTLRRANVVGGTSQALEFSVQVADELDRIASQFSTAGYAVIRIPALIPDQADRFDEAGNVAPQFPFLTYNNVLMERKGQSNIVYLPRYGLSTLDAAAISRWEQLGYEVRPIGGFAISSMYGGSLRCCTKVLLRQ